MAGYRRRAMDTVLRRMRWADDGRAGARRAVRPRARRHLRSGAAALDRRADRGRARPRRRRRVRRPGPLRRHRARARPAAGDAPTSSTAADVSPAVDAALDDAIAHCRAFNEQLMARATDWTFEPEPGLHVGEKVDPDHLGRPVRAVRQGQLPERRLPARRAGGRRRRAARSSSSCRRSPAATARSTRRCSSCAASSASPTCSGSTARPAWPRSASAPSRSPGCARSSAPARRR